MACAISIELIVGLAKEEPEKFSSAGSSHTDKSWYEIPHEYLSDWVNLSGKLISTTVDSLYLELARDQQICSR